MPALPTAVFSAAQVRAIDLSTQREAGIAGYVLMRRAAEACLPIVRALACEQTTALHIVCGPGNNGGDGYALALLAAREYQHLTVWAVGSPPAGGDAARALAEWQAAGGAVQPWRMDALDGIAAEAIVVDALFGLGLSRPLQGAAAQAVEAINSAAACGAVVLAVDLPSGLDADTGAVLGVAVRATATLNLIGLKTGLFLGDAPGHVGRLHCDALGVPAALLDRETPQFTLLHPDDLACALPPRPRAAHKGSHGHVLVIGGAPGTGGAALLAGRAALRAGAGLVSLATHPQHAAAFTAAQPELMVHGLDDANAVGALIERADVIVIGPGLGQGDWGRALFEATHASADKRPLVIDADALNLLALAPRRLSRAVLTPHPGEAARLLGIATSVVQADRLTAVRALQQLTGGVAVLKGANTLVAGGRLWCCPYGNPGMAVGGMGDTLTGIVAAFLAQRLPLEDAARLAVLAHALAGDRAAGGGERGLLPGDVIDALRSVING